MEDRHKTSPHIALVILDPLVDSVAVGKGHHLSIMETLLREALNHSCDHFEVRVLLLC